MMTAKQYAEFLNKRIREVSFANPLIRDCVSDAHADYVRRIFVEGRKADETPIGSYKNKRYKEKRQKRGRQTGYVDLRFEGTLETDVANSLQKRSNFVMINGARNRVNGLKIDGQSERYGQSVFEAGDKIKQGLAECLADQLVKIMTT